MKHIHRILALILALAHAATAQTKFPLHLNSSGHIERNVTVPSGKTLTLSGTLSGTPTGGTLDLSGVTLTLPAAVGDVDGPAGAVSDNSIVRWDGTTGRLVQGISSVTISDAGEYASTANAGFIATFGPNAHITTYDPSAYIRSFTFRMWDGTFYTDLTSLASADYTVTLVPTGSVTMTLPNTNFTAARTDAAQTFTGLQTIATAIALPDGALGAATGAVYFTSDTDTGWYRSASNTQNFICGGLNVLQIGYDGTNQTFGISASPLTRVVSTGEQFFAMQNAAAAHMGIRLGNAAARAYVRAAATPSANVWVVENSAGTAQAGFDSKFGIFLTKTITAGGTTGAQTIDKSSGSVNFAAAATSLVVTNNLVTTSSVIVATVATNDATMKSVAVVAGAGSFTLHANAAATAETRVNFLVTN